MLKNVSDLASQDFSQGLNTVSNIFAVNEKQSPNMMDVISRFDGSIQKRLGSNKQSTIDSSGTVQVGFATDLGSSLTNGLQAFWPLDESAGNRSDLFGGHTLIDGNTVPGVAGVLGNAGSFTASNSEYLQHANSSTLATGDINFSMSAWFNLTTTGERTIMSKRDEGSAATQFDLLMHMSGAQGSTVFADSGKHGLTVTRSGNVIITTGFSAFSGGTSAEFDGTTDSLTVNAPAEFQIGTDDFTFDFRIRYRTHTAEKSMIRMVPSVNNLLWNWHVVGGGRWDIQVAGQGQSINVSTSTGAWHHMAMIRSSGIVKVFKDGVQQGVDLSAAGAVSGGVFNIGASETLSQSLDGYMDEIRFINGSAAFVQNFTPPTSEYGSGQAADPMEYEYWLYVNTDNIVTFKVSSSGTTDNGTIRATDFGAVSTATWYNVVAWHNATGNQLGISVNTVATSAAYTSGVRAGSAPFVIGATSEGGAAKMNGKIDEVGFWKSVLTANDRLSLYNSGNASRFTGAGGDASIFGSFDFGASNIRWLVYAAATGLYASSDLGVTTTVFGTSQTATTNHFERSGSLLIITTDAYDNVLRWDGSGGTHAALLNTSAPLAKYAINHQGFTILLNSNTRKRGFFYEDVNTQLTGDWGDNFDLPSSQDDEITGAFELRRNLYVSTKYRIFRVSYVGGNPDWDFSTIKNWGFVPRTAKKITLKDIGEVIVGLNWDRKLVLFDGADDKIVSDNIENDNGQCDFALNRISFAGSGLFTAHAEVDTNEQVYKLNLTIGSNSTNTTHLLNFDGRTLAFYPYQNQPWQTMVMAESANRRYLLAGDRSTNIVMLDSGNLDINTTPINETYDSSFYKEKSPSEVSKAHVMDLYFSATSSGRMFYQDRAVLGGGFSTRRTFNLTDTGNFIQLKEQMDIPLTHNIYQFRLQSSANTANPWTLNRADFFVSGKGIGRNDG